jgi:16S rRNA A1518/A1519 N6-dimethyltransferase RsmA/KsgA/DIM1 with predicted DNA glycosylase/AP lyase activity
MELTRRMLAALRIQSRDDVVEFAPGMGVTAHLTLELNPASYTAVERDASAAKIVSGYLKGERQQCVVGSASDTGLPDQCATIVYGEAMLTMQTEAMKRNIVREAFRLLKPNKTKTERALTGVVHHGVRPLAVSEWRSLLWLDPR